METNRRIVVNAIQTKENVIIPIWDERIIFEKTEMYGNIIKLKDNYQKHYHLIECIFDIKTKKLELGIEVDIYPSEKDLPYKKGENVLVEKSHKKLADSTIVDIVYEQYDLKIVKGKKLDKWYKERIKGVEIDDNSLYAIKHWKPFYILENGDKIEWEHELYHKV